MSERKTPVLEVRGLHATVEGEEILQGVDLSIQAGEMHVLMGPNGSGKSTLTNVLAGREGYKITAGEILLDGQNLAALSPEERAWAGLFLGFQYPSAVEGLSNTTFLREVVNAKRKREGKEPLDPLSFLRVLREEIVKIPMPEHLIRRNLNVGFSGGEKKLNEVLQLALLEPRLAVLDETDSGLDLDALRNVASAIHRQRTPERSFLLITHYQRLIGALEEAPDRVHIFAQGKIVRSGDATLAEQLEQVGYDALISEAA